MTARLFIGSSIHSGWTRIQVSRSLEQLTGVFTLAVTDRDPGTMRRRRISQGQPCSVMLDGETVITGHVDAVRVSYDSGSHMLQIRGRDRTGDLVDCSAALKPGEWLDTGLEEIANQLCSPFGVSVNVSGDAGEPFAKFRVETGETVFDVIERMCRMRGLLAWSNPNGELEIGTPSGDFIGRLELGRNIVSMSGQSNNLHRHSTYTIFGQQPGSDDVDGELAAHVTAEASDPAIRRHRPLVVVAEQGIDAEEAQKRVDWEASVRAARSRQIAVVVQGWRVDGDRGELWDFGRTVRVRDEWLGFDGDLLVSAVEFGLSNAGTTTKMTLAPAAAFQPELAEPAEGSAPSGGDASDPEFNWWLD